MKILNANNYKFRRRNYSNLTRDVFSLRASPMAFAPSGPTSFKERLWQKREEEKKKRQWKETRGNQKKSSDFTLVNEFHSYIITFTQFEVLSFLATRNAKSSPPFWHLLRIKVSLTNRVHNRDQEMDGKEHQTHQKFHSSWVQSNFSNFEAAMICQKSLVLLKLKGWNFWVYWNQRKK